MHYITAKYELWCSFEHKTLQNLFVSCVHYPKGIILDKIMNNYLKITQIIHN